MPKTPHPGQLDFSEQAHDLMQRVIRAADPDAAAAEDAATADAPPDSPKVAAGRKGGHARAAALPAARRSEIARQAADERWAAESQ